MTLYYVEKRGVYGHGVIGIFATLDEAKAACESHTAHPKAHDDGCGFEGDGDGYHDYVVLQTTLGGGQARKVGEWKGKSKYLPPPKYGKVGTYHWEDA